jgi:FtsP/CotA-like multicopper oxidase with cupredoxin domain
VPTGHNNWKMLRIGMADSIFRLDRRELVAGLAASIVNPALPRIAVAQGRQSLTLQAKAGVIALRPGGPDTPIWSLQGSTPALNLRFKRGDELEITLKNDLPVPSILNWSGIDGVPAAEPLAVRTPIVPGGTETFVLPFRQAGSFLCDLRTLGDGQTRPSRPQALVVEESEPTSADREEVLLIEDWRLRPDGTAIAPGIDPTGTPLLYTINGLTTQVIAARTNERLRFRFMNGCQRNVIAIKIERHDLFVVALDGQPAEPFPARNGTVVLAPGARIDAFVDATAPPGSTSAILLHDGITARSIARLVVSNEPPVRQAALAPAPPLSPNGLPAQLDLKNALRFDVTLGGSQADWVTPVNFAITAPPAFRAKAGRTVVLALTNRGASPHVFRLHGHHFRLLDRLDDGWKPFWLDTLAMDLGRTQRIAFSAEYAGRWLMETMGTNWSAPRLVRWFSIE